jgi:hypothetical protein
MKKTIRLFQQIAIVASTTISFSALAQQPAMQYYRPNNQKGVNTFETTKNDTTAFTGLKVRVGGNFTQDFQGLHDHNSATPVVVAGVNTNQLMPLTNGFNLAMANLNVDAQLDDGIRMNLTVYLSTRHHQDAWVKGGYVQFDKLLFLKSRFVDSLMKNFTIRAGDYELDYGDQHFRRSDGGNSIYNPFVENYIMDEFDTEIGGEIYYHPKKSGLIAMFGVSNGELNPLVTAPTAIDPATGKTTKYSPAFHGKLGYDKQLTKDFRLRITGSFYTDKSAASNTLFFGDRTGSHYFYVMENTAATTDGNAWSGRYNPQFSQQVNTFIINPFLKYKGLEFFGTYEMAQGRTIAESTMRKATQYAGDLIYRFCQKENFWVGVRYNSVTNSLPLIAGNVTINRIAASAGWFVTKNIMLKAEYVKQQYKNFAPTDIRSGGKFNGYMLEASLAF